MAKFNTSVILSGMLWWLPSKGVAGPVPSLLLLFDGQPGVFSFFFRNFSQIHLNFLGGRKYDLHLSSLLEINKA